MPELRAADSALEKSLQAMTTCQSPLWASTLAAARPSPDEAPVMTTVGFVTVDLVVLLELVGASIVLVAWGASRCSRHGQGLADLSSACCLRVLL